MTCRDGSPHSQGCPCWNEKVRADAFEQVAVMFEARFRCVDHSRLEALERGLVCASPLQEAAKIRALAEKHRLEAGEAALRDM